MRCFSEVSCGLIGNCVNASETLLPGLHLLRKDLKSQNVNSFLPLLSLIKRQCFVGKGGTRWDILSRYFSITFISSIGTRKRQAERDMLKPFLSLVI